MGPRCVACICFLGILACSLATSDQLNVEDTDLPLPLLLESLRNDILRLPLTPNKRVSRGVADPAGVPWYSRATRVEDDSAAREELQVTSVIKDESFNYGAGVEKWHSLVVGSTTYLVGLGSADLTLITVTFVAPDVGKGQTYSLSEYKISTGGTPLAATVFKHWNAATKVMEAILVLATDSEDGSLYWYRITDSSLETIRSWPIHKKISYLNVFQVGEQMKLLMITPCNAALEQSLCRASADIFDFNLVTSLDPKLSQALTLEGKAVAAEVGVVGDEVYLALALPDAGLAKLYRYHWPGHSETTGAGNHSTCGWFEFWKDLPSQRVTHAVFFHVSYKMYLAVGGDTPALFRFVSPTRLEGCPKALQNLGFVSAWLVLPVQTYRDEVILLAQVEHMVGSTLTRQVITLTWAGVGVFNWQYQPQCFIGSAKSEVEGVSCIISDSELGLNGAVALQLGEASVVQVLVPRRKKPSSLYRINVQLQPVLNPLLSEVLILRSAQAKLKDELSWQENEMDQTEQILLDTLKADGANVINAEWIIQEVETLQHEPIKSPTQPGLPPEHHTIDIAELKSLLAGLKDQTLNLLASLSDAAVPMERGELHLHGYQTLLGGIEVSGHSVFDSLTLSQLNGESVPTLLQDAVRADRLEKIGGTKTLLNLDIVDVDFAVINDVAKDDLVFNTPNKTIMVHGNLEFTQPLQVYGNVDLPASGTVGGLDLSEEVFLPGKRFEGIISFNEVTVEGDLTVDIINSVTMHPSNLWKIVSGVPSGVEMNITDYDTIEIGGQLKVGRINGIMWDDIVQRIVWRDLSDHIEGNTTINGLVQSVQGIDMWQLNGLDFPSDYVFRTTASQHITGNKTVNNQLLVHSADIGNTIDGVPVDALVTLTTDQRLEGELKLMEADILGDMKVDSAVNGIKLNQMHYKSPLIGEGGVISSNVVFSNVEVEGLIQISNSLDARILKEDLLNILVLSTFNDTVSISGKKTLQHGLTVGGSGITIQSGLVNGKKISGFARLDIPQTFIGAATIENAVFGNLQLSGLWDEVNVVDLNAEAIRVTGAGIQEISTRLSFVEPSKLFASRLVVTEQINNIPVHTVLVPVPVDVCEAASSNPGDECVLKGSVSSNAVRVAGNVVVNGKVCGWKLVDFEKRRMSRSRPQTVHGNFSFVNFDVLSHVDFSTLNSIPVKFLTESVISAVPDVNDFLAGGFAIDELYIQGNIHTQKGVNLLNVASIAQNAVKLNSSNKFLKSLVFEDILSVGSLDVKGPINQLNLAFIIEDAVLKNSLETITVSGEKTFENGFVVDGNILTRNLNGLDPLKIITRTSPNIIQGPLRVLGNVYTGNINVTGLINGIPVEVYQNRYKLLADGRHLLQGNSHFLPGVSVDDLFVMENVKGVNLDEFFSSVVMKMEPSRIPGLKLFINKVIFQHVSVAGFVNNLDLNVEARDVVIYNDDIPVTIQGRITFAKSLTTGSGVLLSGNLDTAELDGCLVKEWVDNAIYLDQPMKILGVKKFTSMSSGSDVKLSLINAVDLSKVIPLHISQDIPANLNIIAAAVRHNLFVGGLVNGRILQSEFDNTLLTTGNQIVTGTKSFLNGFGVQNNIVAKGYISGKDIRNVVTLQGDEIIKGPLKFNNMVIDGDLRILGLLSDLDVEKWKARAFLKKSPDHQVITGAWDIKGQVKFMESVGGEGLLDGENVHDLAEAVYQARRLTSKMQDDIKVDWTQLCHDTDALLQKARAQPFLFQQLESVQSIQSSQAIASMHAFEALNEQFLAVSYINNCSGAMFRWSGHHTAWELIDGAVQNIGSVQRWATLRNAGVTYLVTSAGTDYSCPYKGGNVWRFEPALKLRNVQTMDSWHEAEVDEGTGHVHLLGPSGVNTWRMEDGAMSTIQSWPLTLTGHARFVPRSAGYGLSVTDGEFVRVLRGPEDADNTTLESISRSATSTPYLPAWGKENIVTMTIADGRKLVAVTADDSDLLVVYEDVATKRALARIQVHGAHSLSVLELTAPGRNGQTLLAFIENERQLRVVQYRGVEGFVDVTKAKLAVSVKEMVPIRLHARGLVNQRHFLLLRSDFQVLLLEVEMAGDPLDEPSLNCNLP